MILKKCRCAGEKDHKYFVAYKDDDYKINVLPKTSTYVKSYDGETKWMDLSTEDDDLLEIYTSIWNKISNSIKEELDCQPMYN